MGYKKNMLPANMPARKAEWFVDRLQETLKEHGAKPWNEKDTILFLCEAFWRDSMGKKGVNDRSLFDDVLCVLGDGVFVALPWNADPNGFRPGHGTGSSKGMATIHYGVFKDAYGIGTHKGVPRRIRQFGEITVRRDADDRVDAGFTLEGRDYYLDTGSGFACNGHPAGASTTSSEGCFTGPTHLWALAYEPWEASMKARGQKRCTLVKARVQG